jgi:hypothetical protein
VNDGKALLAEAHHRARLLARWEECYSTVLLKLLERSDIAVEKAPRIAADIALDSLEHRATFLKGICEK